MPLTLSERALAISPSVTLSVDARAKQLRAEGVDVIGFSAGEPDFNTPEYINDAGKFAIDAGITRYTPVAGTLDLREKICEKFRHDNGVDYTPAEIIVSNGAKQSLFIALCAMLNPGDEVLLPSPCWVSYPEMIRMAGGTPVMIHGCEENNFVVTADMMRPYVTERTKALILNSPNNPNGCVWSRQELADIAALAVECGFYVISDEIYEKLIYDDEKHYCMASFGPEIKKQCIVVNGVSKTYAMTGWRIGYAAGPKNVIKAMTSFQSHATSGANSIAQYAAATALSCGDKYILSMIDEYNGRRKLMHRLVNEIDGMSCKLPKGAFYIMASLKEIIGRAYKGQVITGSTRFAELLLDEKHVAVVPALAFGDDNYIRLSYATSRQNIVDGMARMKQFVSELD
ncbi:MAG TPA: pyridoxal phosphate-dependent aminotransferase [Candidatus Faecivicinus avistercoris]|nr:pyridoxal phosphate-dependent aminotransferase [Candidatus Faecivicinus avistercoris]